jgi:hypothetical protein
MNDAFDLLEKSLVNKKNQATIDNERLERMAKETEKTKRMGFSSQERIQHLMNEGLLDKQELVNSGALSKQQLENSGLLDREQAKESGMNMRQGKEHEHQRSLPVFKEHKNKSTDAMGLETETSRYENVNTWGGMNNGKADGAIEKGDLDFLNTPRSTKATSSYGNNLGEDPESGFLEANGRRFEITNGQEQEVAPRSPLAQVPEVTPLTNPGQTMHSVNRVDLPQQYSFQASGFEGNPQTPQPSQQRSPMGQQFINSNIGHTLGLDKARTVANTFNQAAIGTWNGLGQVGDSIINRGVKPVVKWAGQEYKNPYERKMY